MKKIIDGLFHARRGICLTVVCMLVLGVHVPSFWSVCAGAESRAEMSREQALSLGERMYRKGILPSGEPMKTSISESSPVAGTTFACVACHRRSGLGTKERSNEVPPTNGAKLFQPRYGYFPDVRPSERPTVLPPRFNVAPFREAYTNATLAVAIREGIAPDKRGFNTVMPRYRLSDDDMKILIDYLANLSSKPSPGVTEESIAFATIVTDDVPKEDRQAFLRLLDLNILKHNGMRSNQGNMARMISMRVMALSYRSWSLAHWVLKGPPETWETQLLEYYKKGPVFAVLTGLSNSSWEPIHKFCENHEIPCILPMTDLPAVSSSDYYTLYFSKGYYQEGEAAARYLDNNDEPGNEREIVQVVGPGPEARALARGFEEVWSGTGKKPVKTITLKEKELLEGKALAQIVQGGENRNLLLWTGPETYEALDSLAAAPDRPAAVLMSSSLLGGRLWDLPSKAREFTLLTYPWREPVEKKVVPPMGGAYIIVNKEFRKNDRRIASRTKTAFDMLTEAFTMMGRNFYRDYLLDLIDQSDDLYTTDYEQLVFVPQKRYLSEGCYIMQLSRDPNPTLVTKSDWVQQ